MPSLSEPWPIPVITQEPLSARTTEERQRFLEDFNRGVDERNAERLAGTTHHATTIIHQS